MEYRYNVGELKRFIAESSTKNEFNPRIGDGVESKDKSENGKAYKEATKRAKDFDNGLQTPDHDKEVTRNGDDFNQGMLDLNPDNEPSKEYKDRIKLQAQGYTSQLDKDNKIETDDSVEYNEKNFNLMKKDAEARDKAKFQRKRSGLTANKMPEETFEKETVFENIKTVSFKNTIFLNEQHMCFRIPDELKLEGQKFHMIDKAGNDYLVEWRKNEANVLSHENKIQLAESLNRMKSLIGYNPEVNTKTKRRQL